MSRRPSRGDPDNRPSLTLLSAPMTYATCGKLGCSKWPIFTAKSPKSGRQARGSTGNIRYLCRTHAEEFAAVFGLSGLPERSE